MAKVEITNGDGARASVTKEGELLVSVSPFPAFKAAKARPFRQYLTDDGTASGSNDMGVDGSVTNQSFYVQADNNDDRYISNISLIVGYGTSAQPYQFADSTALTNGIRFYYTSYKGEVDIHDSIKTNQDVFRLSHSQLDSSWEIRGINASNDYGYIITIDLENFLPQYGVKLDAGSNQKLVMEIRDDCSNADSFDAIAYGFDRFA